MKDKPHNSGKWTTARMRSFVMSQLRGGRWPVKYESIGQAYVGDGINPATGRTCKLHQCVECGEQFPKGQMQADHIDPVVPLDGKWGETTEWLGINFNELLPRLYCELDKLQPLCKGCHKSKSAEERKIRNQHKKERNDHVTNQR